MSSTCSVKISKKETTENAIIIKSKKHKTKKQIKLSNNINQNPGSVLSKLACISSFMDLSKINIPSIIHSVSEKTKSELMLIRELINQSCESNDICASNNENQNINNDNMINTPYSNKIVGMFIINSQSHH